MNFIKTLKRDKQLRKKFCITLSILLLCRILAAIPTPGINTNYFKAMMELNGSFGLLNIITGNGLDSLSLMTLSIAPYITASIIIQRQTVNSSVKKLVQNGCVVLESGKGHDKQIVLTEKGKAMAKQKIIPVMEAEAGVFMHMTEEERKKLLRLNAKYMEIFRQKVGELRL